ncbi:MAG: GIY-YIG nuclease family protein, partial [Thermomicrobiales bacterium]
SIDGLRSGSRNWAPRPRDGVGRAGSLIDKSYLDGIPKSPGVYLMRDADHRIIYIGKAKNLRDRVASYYAEPLGYTRKMDGLAEAIARIDVEQTGTELEALILESQLIRRFQPRYNSALKAHENYPYIRVTLSSPWPRVCLAQKPSVSGDRYFGPYRNGLAAKRAVTLLNGILPLRTCTRSFKSASSYGAPCLRLDLRQCPGPCVGQANRQTYLTAIDAAIRFLEGDDDVLIRELHLQLEDSAERQDFEKARHLRNAISTLQSIATAGRRRTSEAFRRHLAVILPSFDDRAARVAIVAAGRIWAMHTSSTDADPAGLAASLARSYDRLREHGDPVVDRTTIDDTAVIVRWLEQNEGRPCIVSEPEDRAWNWDEIARRALDTTYDEFISWSPPVVEEDIVLDVRAVDEIPRAQGHILSAAHADVGISIAGPGGLEHV